MRKILIVCGLLIVAGLALAESTNESVIAADGGLRLYTGSLTGPASIDFLADGTATVVFKWMSQEAPTIVVSKTTGPFELRANVPRSFGFAGGPDSVIFDLTTATEVITTW